MNTQIISIIFLFLSVCNLYSDNWFSEIPATGSDVSEAIELLIRKYSFKFEKPVYWQMKFRVKNHKLGGEEKWSPTIINSDHNKKDFIIKFWQKRKPIEEKKRTFHIFSDGKREADIHYNNPFFETSFNGANYTGWQLNNEFKDQFKLNKEYILHASVGPFADKDGFERPVDSGWRSDIVKHYSKCRNYVVLTIEFSETQFTEDDFIETRRKRMKRKE